MRLDEIREIVSNVVERVLNEDIHSMNRVRLKGNDELYTALEDVEKELKHYHKYFNGKRVYCCCCDDRWSMFWKYLSNNFDIFGINELICTHLENPRSYMLGMRSLL